jgi:transposase
MAMGKRNRDRPPTMWVTTTDLPTAASHPFYRCLNHLLREQGFDDFGEAQCASFYAEIMGRPSLPPGIYFRLLLIGYFEGINSGRGIAWRTADSLALRDFWVSGRIRRRRTTRRFPGRDASLPSKRIARRSRGCRNASGMPV